MVIKKLETGDSAVTLPFIAHNVFMREGAITHTVKFGQCRTDDWHASAQLDSLTKHLTEADLENKNECFH